MKKILHWLACHTVIIVLLVFIAIAVFFRGPLFGIWPEPEKATVAPAPAPAPAFSEQPLETPQSVEPEPVAESIEPEIPAQKTQSQQAAPQPEIAVSVSDDDAGAEPQNESDNSSLPVTVIQPSKPEVLQQDENYQFRPPQEEPYQPDADEPGDLLQQARKAYWNDELLKSRSLYEEYITANPNNPDGYGELGNLLSTMGDLDKAAQMYRKAADILTSEGEMEQAQRLEEVLSSIEVIQNMPE